MRVPFNGFSNNLISELTRLNSNQVNLQKQLSSGQRIAEAYEDPLASGRALSTSTEKARIQTQARNLNRAQLVAEFSSETLEQMKVVANKASLDANKTDGLTSQADYEARGLQTNQLIEQVLRVANAQVAGDYLFAGANTGEQPFVANRYEEGDNQVDANGVEIRELQDSNGSFLPAELDASGDPVIPVFGAGPGAPLDPTDPTEVVFVNSDGAVVDAETGEATSSPPTAATDLVPQPDYVVEWAGANSGRLKEWDGTDYSNDAVDSSSNTVGDVVIADDGGSPVLAHAEALNPASLVFIDGSGNVVDSETGEATTSPPTAASSLGPPPPSYVVEWAAEDTGQLKQWNGSDYSADATDAAGNAYGEVTIANDGTSDFVGRVDKVAITEEMVGMVSYIEYTGTSDPDQDVAFRVGEGATISPFSRGSTNLEYLDFMNDMVALRDAYFDQKLEQDDPAVSHNAKAQAVEDLVPRFDDHQNTVLLGIVEFGSLQQGIEVTQSINDSRFNELERLSSRELDIDVAETIVKLNRSQTAYEAALNSGSRIMQLSLLDYIQ